MKKKKIVRQFQNHIIFTLIILAVMSFVTVYLITGMRKEILPDESELYIDVTSTFADGTNSTETYKMKLDNNKKEFSKNNDSVTEAKENDDEEVVLYAFGDINVEEALLLRPSVVQTGTNFSVSKIQNGFSKLSKSKQQEYTTLGHLRYILPIIYCLFGVIISCYIFYRIYLKKPIEELENATEKISARNLDFTIKTKSKNELGRLCDSFEDMRKALVTANSEMLQMIDERRRLQSSVAHDLRNPIAIMKGYIEILEEDSNDKGYNNYCNQELATLSSTVSRMENYVDSVSRINKLGDMELNLKEEVITDCVDRIINDMKVLTGNMKINITFKNSENDCIFHENEKWKIDSDAILRVLENVIGNSIRYAKEKIRMQISIIDNEELIFDIQDDGKGYPEKLLKNSDLYFFTTEQKNGHMGMGMAICRIICKKHHGSIEISNNESGGAHTIIKIKNMSLLD